MLKKSNIQPQPPNDSETIVVVRSANPGSIVERLITFKKSHSAAILIARRSFVATLARDWETHRQFVVATLVRAWEIPARIHLLATVATFNQQSWAQSSETGAVQLSNGRQAARFTFELAKRRDLRPAFTLIELLVVMGLIGFLASMLTYALLGAQADARVARTRGTITKLNDVILAQWEEYRYRPVDMRKPVGLAIPSRLQAHLRMLILRDMMRMEMPDRVEDLLFEPAHYVLPVDMPPQWAAFSGANLEERAFPHKFGTMRQALESAIANSIHKANLLGTQYQDGSYQYFERLNSQGFTTGSVSQPPRQLFATSVSVETWIRAVQSSELLYLIVANSQYAGSPSLESFRASEIGDPDEDGLLEFIDAWGNAIHWIRWPAGYPSDLNRYSGTDAMDPLRTDWRYSDSTWTEEFKPKTIVPLVLSAGADENFGIVGLPKRLGVDSSTPESLLIGFIDGNERPIPLRFAQMQRGFNEVRWYVDPFFTITNGNINTERPFLSSSPFGYLANQLGGIPLEIDGETNETATDNITNHDIILGL